MNTQVVSLHIYPIKSCAGFSTQSFELGPRGPKGDREWMIIDAVTHEFLTQRQLPTMAFIQPRFVEEGSDKVLRIELPAPAGGKAQYDIPMAVAGQKRAEIPVKVWKDECLANDEGDEIAEALSRFLGKDVRLVRMAQDFKRHLPEKYGHPDAHTGFSDSMPLLLASIDSLTEVNTHLSEAVPINRFRANIVIEGAPAFEEDKWSKLEIGTVEFEVSKACTRCVIINTDQNTAARGTEPLKAMATFRRNESGKVLFGQYLIHRGQGEIRVGMPVAALSDSQESRT